MLINDKGYDGYPKQYFKFIFSIVALKSIKMSNFFISLSKNQLSQ